MRMLVAWFWRLIGACCLPIRFVVNLFTSVPEVVVLFYHSISASPDDPYAVRPDAFERQMGIVRRVATPVTLSDVVAFVQGHAALPRRAVAITFDDGYRDFAEHALPVLKREGTPFTLFVSRTPNRKELDNHHQLLSPEEIRELAREPLAEIGAHGVTHRKLTALADEEVLQEMAESKLFIESLTGKPCRFFAYPKGASDPRVRALAAKAGFLAAFTTKQGIVRRGRELLSMKRILVSRDVSPFLFSIRLTRIADWMAALRKPFLKYVH